MVVQRSLLDLLGGRSAKFGAAVFKASILNWQGGRSADRSAKFGVAVFKVSILDWREGSVGRSANFELIYISCFASQKVFSY